MTEDQLQQAIIARCDLYACQDERWGEIFHVPNGGARNKREGAKFKRLGVRRGVPDLLWLLPREETGESPSYNGLAMELKAKKRKPTKEQVELLDRLTRRGYFTCVVTDDPDEAFEILRWYLQGVRDEYE